MTFSPARRFLPPVATAVTASVLFLATACYRPAAAPQAAAAPEDRPAPAAPPAKDADWPMFGGSIARNMANTAEKDMPEAWAVKKGKEQNVKWNAELGADAYGGGVVAGGRVFIGTNNSRPRDPNVTAEKGVLMCLDEASGKFLWQIVHDKLANTTLDNGGCGVVSTPCVDGDRVYYVSNRCELVCADVAGDPAAPGKGKVVWSLDMVKDLKVWPGGLQGSVASGSPLVIDDLVYTVTSNGVNQNTEKVQNPDAPSFIAVDKMSGHVVWSSNLPGANVMDGQWSNPAAAEVNGVKEVIFPGGDGWLYGFEAKKGELLWKFDCNPKKSEFKPAVGTGTRNYLVATPVVADGKVYIGVGREPDEGQGVGHFWCIDITKKPANKDKDLSPVNDNFDSKDPVNKDSGLVWHLGGFLNPKPTNGDREYPFGRTLSTAAVHDGLVYAAELDGFLHCLDAKTGQEYWVHDLGGGAWASPYYVDGKVYMSVDNGDLLIFAAGKEDKQIGKIEMQSRVLTSPVAANGILFVHNDNTLYAIKK
jgi:outer membrane protein assembly factor BamB